MEKLAGYIHEYAENYLHRSSIHCRLERPDTLPDCALSSEVRHNIFLTLKEGLHNAVKHSGASEVRIVIQVTYSILSLSMVDNGKGFSIGEVSSFGNGLQNMRKRIESIGGKFILRTEPRTGTRIAMEILLRR